jgi:uroporphyrinogen-III synthase
MIVPLSLQNKTVLNPRGKKSAQSFSKVVEKYGGLPIEIPLIDFKPIELTSELNEIRMEIQTYDWIIFTSNVTVETFFTYMNRDDLVIPHLAAIGEKTAQVLIDKGCKVHFTPSKYVAETFVEEFSTKIHPGTKVLLPKGNLARDYIYTQLTKLGAIVEDITIYETVFPIKSKTILEQMLIENKLDIICFTSPSTVDHFMGVVENRFWDKLHTCVIACIGPIAQKRAEKWGLTVHVVPKHYTVEEMIKSTAEYLLTKSNS